MDNIVNNRISGHDLEELLLPKIRESVNGVEAVIAKYDRQSLFKAWLGLIRMQEELINIYYELNGDDLKTVMEARIGGFFAYDKTFFDAVKVVEYKFSSEVAKRFSLLVNIYSRQNCVLDCIGRNYLHIKTVKDLLLYTQSRRLYYVSILHLIPIHANGTQCVDISDLPNDFGAYIDLCLRSVTTGCQSIVASRCLKDYYADTSDLGLRFCQTYSHLEGFFLEPLMMTSLDIMNYDEKFDMSILTTTRKRGSLYSYEELEDILQHEIACFANYGIDDLPMMEKVRKLILLVRPFFKDDYFIEISSDMFNGLCKLTGLELHTQKDEYFDILNSRDAFVRFEDTYYSTYFLLVRYIVNTIYRQLRRKKRYQIKAGFFFEDKVSSILEKYGFTMISGVKRINHKEFDVVCLKDGIIYNFQCKNNYMNVSDIDTDIINVVTRYHKRLASYYDRALKKEFDREGLLVDKIGISKVENYVISRYPVLTSNPRVIPFNRLEIVLKDGL